MKRGHVLLEIIIGFCIVFIIFSFLYVSPSAFYNNLCLEFVAKGLVSDLKWSKLNAYSKGADVCFYFIKDNQSSDYVGYSISQNLKTLKKVMFPKNIVVSRSLSTFSSSGILTFNPNGSVSPYACSIVVLNKSSGKNKKITLTIGFTRITEK
ncbi:hypothetical protein SAMN05660865_01087 [Caloramator fervidus]|uniref:Prepilin-type N-terminal cleavage/methylation domain-containing protein n=1 Tax=Caloramator fervidus TaxID=29344 RepID=A0A1H5V5D1_9CLOT|nr:hypothetical protein [Caloramator fervidus]SEF81657.1 hypothetical protein SAMN05660865_01087 [Caloramator fervidus]